MIMWLASKPLAICSANQKAKGRLMGQGCCWCSPAPASSPAPKRPPHPGKQAGGQATSAQQSVLFIYHLSTGLLSPGWSSVSYSCRAPHWPEGPHRTTMGSNHPWENSTTPRSIWSKWARSSYRNEVLCVAKWIERLTDWWTDYVNTSLSTTCVLSLQIPRITGVDNIIIPVLQVRKLKLKKIQQHVPII